MEKRRILDIKYPKITAYPHHAHIMAIIGEDEHKLSWFYNSYIQLQINKNGYNKMDFCVGYNINPILYNCPWITCHGISRTLLKKGWNSIIEFLIDSINDGYYIYIGVDEYYIPSYDSFNKQHSVHDMLVYGYDLSKEKFYIADFFKERKYNFALCDFKEMEKAHVQTDQSDSFNGVMLIKPKDYTYNYSFCIYTVKKLIKDYIECKNSNLRTIMLNTNSVYKDEYLYAYGLEVYKVLKTSLYTLTIKDIRPFYVLYEHKKIMKFLIKYLNDNGYLSKADKFYSIYEDLVCKTKILVNTMIKYFLTKSECIANHAIEILDNIYDIESNILYDLYNNIKELGRLDTVSNASLDCNSFYLKFYGQWNEDYVHSYTKKEKLIKQTEIKGSYVQCTFYGSYIAYIANKNKKCGYAKIEIDGIYYGIVDLYSEEEIDEIVFSTYKLVLGYHTLKITCLGEQNMYSQGSSINFKEIYTLCDNNKSVIETEVRFIKEDSITKGDWIGEYGVDGVLVKQNCNTSV
nr:hypothetical protein [uncultured Cellulosilyticum sp.]